MDSHAQEFSSGANPSHTVSQHGCSNVLLYRTEAARDAAHSLYSFFIGAEVCSLPAKTSAGHEEEHYEEALHSVFPEPRSSDHGYEQR